MFIFCQKKNKIYIYQSTKLKGNIRSQSIKIVYKFVGAIDIPNIDEKG